MVASARACPTGPSKTAPFAKSTGPFATALRACEFLLSELISFCALLEANSANGAAAAPPAALSAAASAYGESSGEAAAPATCPEEEGRGLAGLEVRLGSNACKQLLQRVIK